MKQARAHERVYCMLVELEIIFKSVTKNVYWVQVMLFSAAGFGNQRRELQVWNPKHESYGYALKQRSSQGVSDHGWGIFDLQVAPFIPST
jgi:hypothetical protein